MENRKSFLIFMKFMKCKKLIIILTSVLIQLSLISFAFASTTIELFDETPPEAEIFFDFEIQELTIRGIDNTTVNPIVTLFEDEEEDEDDEILTLVAKFRVRDLVDATIGKKVELTITANLLDGTKIEGSDTVRIIRGHKHDKYE